MSKARGKVALADPEGMKKLSADGYREVLLQTPVPRFGNGREPCRTVEWSQENSALPTRNYREAVFEAADEIGGFAMEKIKVSNRGCPQCNMTCGNVVRDSEGQDSELDYENVVMLGSNIGLGDLREGFDSEPFS